MSGPPPAKKPCVEETSVSAPKTRPRMTGDVILDPRGVVNIVFLCHDEDKASGFPDNMHAMNVGYGRDDTPEREVFYMLSEQGYDEGETDHDGNPCSDSHPFYCSSGNPRGFAFVFLRGEKAIIVDDNKPDTDHVLNFDDDALENLRKIGREWCGGVPKESDSLDKDTHAILYVQVKEEGFTAQVMQRMISGIKDESLRGLVAASAGFKGIEGIERNEKFDRRFGELACAGVLSY